MNTSIDVDKFNVKYTTTKSVLFTSGFMCFLRNNNVYCVGHDYQNARIYLKYGFPEVACLDYSSSLICSGTDLSCFVVHDGRFGCVDKGTNLHCEVDKNGIFEC